MREATVSDAIDFSGIAEQMEEVATSLFLDRLQDKALWTNPKLWTGEDRRFALFWYWLHTEEDHDIALSFECPVCGETHTQLIDCRGLAENYAPIQGRPERDIELQGKKVTVRPVNGAGLEVLESLRLAASLLKEDGKIRQAKTRLALTEMVLSVQFEDEPEENGRALRERRIEQMSLKEFEDFAGLVFGALLDMRHGLECEKIEGRVNLITPPVHCPNQPQEVGTRLRVPFRTGDYIPRIL